VINMHAFLPGQRCHDDKRVRQIRLFSTRMPVLCGRITCQCTTHADSSMLGGFLMTSKPIVCRHHGICTPALLFRKLFLVQQLRPSGLLHAAHLR